MAQACPAFSAMQIPLPRAVRYGGRMLKLIRTSCAVAVLTVSSCAMNLPTGQAAKQVSFAPPAQDWVAACKDWDDWDKSGPPYRIHGDTYFVGTCGITAILIVGEDGHVLIDGATEKGASVIAANIERLGLDLSDVKLLLHTHEHYDHVGGTAHLQKLTGARLLASANAAPVFASGKPADDDPQHGDLRAMPPMAPARIDGIVRPEEPVRLGDIELVPMATPGHTSGALSWGWRSCDEGGCRAIIYADSLSPISAEGYRFKDHPSYITAFRESLARLRQLDCDVLLTPHPSASQMRDRLAAGSLVGDGQGCRAYADSIEARLDERLAKEAAR